MSKTKVIGYVNIDTAQMAIGDVINLERIPKLNGKKNYTSRNGVVVLMTGCGDGLYPVEATLAPNGMIAKIEINFLDESWLTTEPNNVEQVPANTEHPNLNGWDGFFKEE